MTAGRLVTAAVVGALALAAAAPSAPTSGSGAVFRLRPDLRMCPSPLCGGFFVSRVNRTSTTCSDGAARPWCYVASVDLPLLTAASRARVRAAEQSGGVLLRGRIGVGGSVFRGLGRLVVTDAWLTVTSEPWGGSVFLVSDNGVRCIRAPCFSLRASVVNTTRASSASGVDLSMVGASPALVRKAQANLATGGLLVAGTIRRAADGGRTVVAAQFFLQAR
jgi:hypothetical protein